MGNNNALENNCRGNLMTKMAATDNKKSITQIY